MKRILASGIALSVLVMALVLFAPAQPLNLVDRYSSTLGSSYTSGGGTLTVASATGLPSGACYFIAVVKAEGANTDEYFLVTNVSGTTLTVTGAQSGSSASNHASGAVIKASIMTAGAYTQLLLDALSPATVNHTTGNIITPGSLTTGYGSGVAGVYDFGQGTAPSFSASNTFSLFAPASISSSYQWKVPAADAAGLLYSNGAGTPGILSIKTLQGTDSKIPTSDSLSGATGDTLCKSANGGITTSGCSGGGSGVVSSVNGYTGSVSLPIYGTATIVPPVTGDWTAIGSSGTRSNVTGPSGADAINVIGTTGGTTGTANIYGIKHSVAAGDFTHIFILWAAPATAAASNVGVGFTDGTKVESCVAQGQGSNVVAYSRIKSSSLTTGYADANGATGFEGAAFYPLMIAKLTRTGTALACSISLDGGITYRSVFNDTSPYLTASDVVVTTDPRGAAVAGVFTLISYN